ncbi:hypothetical protein PIROE2DRAFT_4719 [Piromyces sp. E2]|nr:hypothetical protein PIROE2DRAFT_4719 [Piromyces sp. E2]|eukprot:OUM67766.1 hypothetical protein PIROE2DRAFT_4719 [Piromyces sp. E2]
MTTKVLGHLLSAKKSLTKAKRWSRMDVTGGGCFIYYIKQGHVGRAEVAINNANKSFLKLKEKVGRIKELESLIKIKNDPLSDLTDCFMNEIMYDDRFSFKISDAKKKCKIAITDVEAIKKELEQRLKTLS